MSLQHLLRGVDWLSDALLQGCGVPHHCPPPQSPARLRDAGVSWGGPYLQGWCQTPAGCSTQGCRTSCRTHIRWPPARSQDGLTSSSPSEPHQSTQGPQSPQHRALVEMGMSLPTCKVVGGATSIQDLQDPSGPGALLTIKAEKMHFGALDTEEMVPPAPCR